MRMTIGAAAALGVAGLAMGQSCEPGDLYAERDTFGSIPNGQKLAVGDVNNDGVVDLVSTNAASSVYVLLATGPGTYAPAVPYFVNSDRLNGVALADFDGDGFLDIAVANPNNDRPRAAVQVLLNDGDGTFGVATSWRFSDRPEFVVATDINGDGNADLVVADQRRSGFQNLLGVRLGNGDGTFGTATLLNAADFPRRLIADDLDGDGDADVALAHSSGVDVFLNVAGELALPVTYAGFVDDTSDLTLGDADNDGDLDLLVLARPDGSTPPIIGFLANDGFGIFADPVFVDDRGFSYASLDAADINGDGNVDCVAITGGTTSLWLGDGLGGFTRAADLDGASNRFDIALTDLDNDGDPDVATTGNSVAEVRLNQCVAFPPVIRRDGQPQSVAVDAGASAELRVEVLFGTQPLAFQWRRNGVDLIDSGPISGATSDVLTIGPATSEQSDVYDVVVSNASGLAVSQPAFLAVRNPCRADFDGDGSLTLFDFLAFQNQFAAGCP